MVLECQASSRAGWLQGRPWDTVLYGLLALLQVSRSLDQNTFALGYLFTCICTTVVSHRSLQQGAGFSTAQFIKSSSCTRSVWLNVLPLLWRKLLCTQGPLGALRLASGVWKQCGFAALGRHVNAGPLVSEIPISKCVFCTWFPSLSSWTSTLIKATSQKSQTCPYPHRKWKQSFQAHTWSSQSTNHSSADLAGEKTLPVHAVPQSPNTMLIHSAPDFQGSSSA